jgi:hypothetical protein
MQTRLHLTAAATAVTTTVLFILAAISTALLDTHRTADVRQAMLWGLLVLVPALVITAATGFGLAGTSADPRITAKKRRMSFIAGIGLLQTVEALAATISLALMARNIGDGLRLTARR